MYSYKFMTIIILFAYMNMAGTSADYNYSVTNIMTYDKDYANRKYETTMPLVQHGKPGIR